MCASLAVSCARERVLRLRGCCGLSVSAVFSMAGFFEAASHFDLDPEPLRKIIEDGKYLARADGDGLTLLHFACREGHADAVTMLIEAGVHLELQDRNGRTPLHLACLFALKNRSRGDGHIAITEILQSNHAMTNTQDNFGSTPLAYLPKAAKQIGIGTASTDGSGARWDIQEVQKGGTVLQGSVAVAAEMY